MDLKQAIFLVVLSLGAAGAFFFFFSRSLLSAGYSEADNRFLLWAELRGNVVAVAAVFLSILYVLQRRRRRPVFLVDFACYKPLDILRCSHEKFMTETRRKGDNDEELLAFVEKILHRSGLGQSTYLPEGMMCSPADFSFTAGRKEAATMLFGAVDELLAKTGVRANDIGIVIVNCGVYSQTPSLSAVIVEHYNLGESTITYNLSGMGCSASLIAAGLAKNLLQIYPEKYCLVTSLEVITSNRYGGNDRNKVLTNCIFRMGSAAILLSNRRSDRRSSKYQLLHTVRTHKAADDRSYCCVLQEDDGAGHIGVSLSKDVMSMAGGALKANLTALGPLVLPLSEKLRFLLSSASAPYVPDFKLAFDHFCIHAGGRAVLDEMEKALGLGEREMEPSRMTLYRFGNVSSSSPWYELAYLEAKGRVREGDRVWQVAFGSGFKCKSAVWRAVRSVDPDDERSPWTDEIHGFPVRWAAPADDNRRRT